MTTKITRKQYSARKAELTAKIEGIKAKLADTTYCQSLPGDGWNDLHDAEYDAEKELVDLDDEWDRRNWTHSDYALHSLICNNID